MKRFIGFLTIILLIAGCQQETEKGTIGQQFLLKADVPDEVGTFDYIWKIIDLPETSELTLSDMQFSEDESQAIFVPDAAGHYNIQVTVWKYNDKLGAIVYTYDITEPSVESLAEQAADDAWLNETVETTVETAEVLTDDIKSSVTDVVEDQPIEEDNTETTEEAVEEVIVTSVTNFAVEANYTIQIAADSNKESAQQVADRFKTAGFDAYIQETTTADNNKMYRIRIGKFATRADAVPTANRIKNEHGMDTWITKYQQ